MNDYLTYPDIGALSDSAQRAIESFFGAATLKDTAAGFMRGEGIEPKGFFEKIISMIGGDLSLALRGAALIVIIAAFCALAENLADAAAGFSAQALCGALMCGVISVSLAESVSVAKTLISDLTLLSHSLVPPLITASIVSGNAVGAGIMHGIIFYSCHAIAEIISNIAVPFAVMSVACALFDCVGEKGALGGFSKLFGSISKYVMGLLMGIFAALLTVGNLTSKSLDAAAKSAARLTVSSLVPVVGSSLSDALESVAGAAAVVRASYGGAACVMLFALCADAALRLGAMVAAYKICAALASPFAPKTASALEGAANCFALLFAASACVSLTLIISVAILAGA